MIQHLAIIMDGNGRWARERHLPRIAGHRKGAETARAIIEHAAQQNIRHLTLYTFSAENWQRPEDEVTELMQLLKHYLSKELDTLIKNRVKLHVMGDLSRLSDDIRAQVEKAEAITAENDRITLHIALSYGSRQELTEAARNIAQAVKTGDIDPDTLSEETVTAFLYTHAIPDPDLLIRTGGEQRLSNFLLWQSAYTELYFTETLWPDFAPKELDKALECYSQRQRRFGRTSEQCLNPKHAANQ